MPARIALLGPPRIERDGVPAPPPRGSKAWALLAYLALTEDPVPRSRLMALLFEEADDPGAALRWSLSQLRRALDGVAGLEGDPLRLRLRPGTLVDAHVLVRGTSAEALGLPTFGGTLLDGVRPQVGAAFDLWLALERRRAAGRTIAHLQEAAHIRLAEGDVASALVLAERLVSAEPLDEGAHELLIRTLVASGDPRAAAEHVHRSQALLRRELGREPGPTLAAALRTSAIDPTPPTRATVEVALDGGTGAAHAGAYERAVELLRPAVAQARTLGDRALLAQALTELGTVLVQGVRGRDEEGISALHEAVVLAEAAGARSTAAAAALQIGHVETLRAHFPQMEAWFVRAAALANGDDTILAWVDVFAGIGRTDQGDYPRGRAALDRAISRARSVADRRAEAYALTALGRLQLLRGELAAARPVLDLACETAQDIGWSSFLPFPRAMRAEVALADGDLTGAADGFERSYALACQVGDPCWESYSLRGRGLLAATRGDDAAALDHLSAAPEACRRLPDTHSWVEGYCLDALCDFAVARHLPEAASWVQDLESFASRRGLRELVVRAALHRRGLGQPGADQLTTALVDTIDNPALAAAVAGLRTEPADDG